MAIAFFAVCAVVFLLTIIRYQSAKRWHPPFDPDRRRYHTYRSVRRP